MSDLQNQTPADTYKGLLQIGDYTNGVDANAEYIQDGGGNPSALSISTTKVGIGTASPSAITTIEGEGSDSPMEGSHLLDIKSTGNSKLADIRLEAQDSSGTTRAGGVGFNPDDNAVYLANNGTQVLNVNQDGSVGINQSGTLGATLQVDANDNSANALAFWVRDVAKTNSIISAYENGNVRLGTFLYEDATGNVGIGHLATFGTNATNTIAIKEGVSPTSSPANLVQLFCTDVSGSAELRVRNEQGVETTLSPHAKDAPSSLYDRPPGAEEMHRSANYYLGTITFTNVDRRNDLLQKQLNGEELPEDRTFTVTETFAEYNARTGADLQVEDWDDNQQAMADADESYVKKPKPEWLS